MQGLAGPARHRVLTPHFRPRSTPHLRPHLTPQLSPQLTPQLATVLTHVHIPVRASHGNIDSSSSISKQLSLHRKDETTLRQDGSLGQGSCARATGVATRALPLAPAPVVEGGEGDWAVPVVRESKRVILVRHGESTWNATGRIQGSSNFSELTVKGENQAETSRQMLAQDTFDICFHR